MKHTVSLFSLLKIAVSPRLALFACLAAGPVACSMTKAATPDASAMPDVAPITTVAEIQRASAGIVGCQPSDIMIETATYEAYHEVWELRCPTGRWICSRQDKFGHEYINCAKSPYGPAAAKDAT